MPQIFILTNNLKIENVDVFNEDIADLFKIDNINNFDSIEKAQKMRDYLDTDIKIN